MHHKRRFFSHLTTFSVGSYTKTKSFNEEFKQNTPHVPSFFSYSLSNISCVQRLNISVVSSRVNSIYFNNIPVVDRTFNLTGD